MTVKEVTLRNLNRYRTWITDSSPTSDYFRISEFPNIFSGGKNSFLIEGSEYLKPTTEVLIEILDSEGNPIFVQPIAKYIEGLSRLVVVEIYNKTPAGIGSITILGEARSDLNGNSVPDEWVGKYNVKWTRDVTIIPTALNTNKIRLYKKPTITVQEVLTPYFEPQTKVTTSSIGPQIFGIPNNRRLLSDSLGSYTLKSTAPYFSSSMEGATITIFGYNYRPTITRVINDTTIEVQPQYTGSSGQVTSLIASSFTTTYNPRPAFLPTLLTRSYADISLNNLETVSGDIARVKVFVRSIDTLTQPQLIDDFSIENTSLLRYKNCTFTGRGYIDRGKFDRFNIFTGYWETGSITEISNIPKIYAFTPSNVVVEGSTAWLMDSVAITDSILNTVDSSTPRAYFTISGSLPVVKDGTYKIRFNAVAVKNSSEYDSKFDVRIVGDGFLSPEGIGTQIIELISPSGAKTQQFLDVEAEFTAPLSADIKPYFVSYNANWYISDISIELAVESGFTPNRAESFVPIIGRRFENLVFYAELYDHNNNFVPITIESKPVYFDGGNVVFKGDDHKLQGTIEVVSRDGGAVAKISTGIYEPTLLSGISGQRTGSSFTLGVLDNETPTVGDPQTPFIVVSDKDTNQVQIGISDKLIGYTDSLTGEFILLVRGTIIDNNSISGSEAVKVRTTTDRYVDRLYGNIVDVEDSKGQYGVSAGEWNSQIARFGVYTRGTENPIQQSPINASITSSIYDAFITQSLTLVSSASINVPSGIHINNGIIYADVTFVAQELSLPASSLYRLNYNIRCIADWTGYQTPNPAAGQSLVREQNILVSTNGALPIAPLVKYPVLVPENRVGNTLYLTFFVVITTESV
jgi:hypothetical protein